MNTLRAVEETGFAILPEVLSSLEAQRLIDEVEQSAPGISKAAVRHALRYPAIAALACERRLLAIAQEVLDGKAVPFRATLFDKSPKANWLVAWHQDRALPLRDQRDTPGWGPWSVKDGVIYANAPAHALCRVIALRICLDDSSSKNGPLRVLPGSHSHGVLSDDAIRDLATQIAPVDCLVSQGGVLAMRPLMVHASSKSRLDTPRRVLHIEYAASTMIDGNLELAVT